MSYPNHVTCWNTCCHYSCGAATSHMIQPLPIAATSATAAELTSYVIEINQASLKHNVFVMKTKGTKLTFYYPYGIKDIKVFAIEPHALHWGQPVDKNPFSGFKEAFHDELRKLNHKAAGRAIMKSEFFQVFNVA